MDNIYNEFLHYNLFHAVTLLTFPLYTLKFIFVIISYYKLFISIRPFLYS